MRRSDDERADEQDVPVVGGMFDAEGALSREFLLRRGFCCELGCKNCPYPSDNERSGCTLRP